MIAFLRGRLVSKDAASAIIDVGGVGYRVGMSTSSLGSLVGVGEEITVFTYLQVRDDGFSLYGFTSSQERSMFEKLIAVSGVGPKMALAALSTFSSDTLSHVIAAEDVTRVATIPGVGKKTAQRIILELKGALEKEMTLGGGVGGDTTSNAATGATEALYTMGFTPGEVELAFRGYEGDTSDAGALVRFALKRLGAS